MSADLNELQARVAAHIGAASVDAEGRMTCPKCGGDFGPNDTWRSLAVYEDGFLPGAPLLVGVCLDCEHTTEPKAFDPYAEELATTGRAVAA